MKTYEIPISWQSIRKYTVDANSLQEAAQKALEQFLSEPDEEYLCDSFEIDSVIEEDYPEEDINYNSLLQ